MPEIVKLNTWSAAAERSGIPGAPGRRFLPVGRGAALDRVTWLSTRESKVMT
jgi:hypothetical protein